MHVHIAARQSGGPNIAILALGRWSQRRGEDAFHRLQAVSIAYARIRQRDARFAIITLVSRRRVFSFMRSAYRPSLPTSKYCCASFTLVLRLFRPPGVSVMLSRLLA